MVGGTGGCGVVVGMVRLGLPETFLASKSVLLPGVKDVLAGGRAVSKIMLE